MFCQEQETGVPPVVQTPVSGVVPSHLLPLVVRFLTDTNSQVRKTSQAALLVLLEQGLVETCDVVDQVLLRRAIKIKKVKILLLTC